MARSKTDVLVPFRDAFLAFRIDSIDREVQAVLEAGGTGRNLLRACQQCMDDIGKKFEAGEYYLPELVVSGEMFKMVSRKIRPLLSGEKTESRGKIVLGTPQGDIHNLGKDIFGILAESGGFTVYDLGVDVPPRSFLDKVKETGATVLGMSALVTAAFSPMEEVVSLLEKSGLRPGVRVVIGGGVTGPDMVRRLRVDAQTRDAFEGLRIVRSFLETKEKTRATL